MKASGADRSHGGEAARKRGGKNRENIIENINWDNKDIDLLRDVTFDKDILPGLQDIPISRNQKATGLSLRYCWLIRHGEVPHKRHWINLLYLIREKKMR